MILMPSFLAEILASTSRGGQARTHNHPSGSRKRGQEDGGPRSTAERRKEEDG